MWFMIYDLVFLSFQLIIAGLNENEMLQPMAISLLETFDLSFRQKHEKLRKFWASIDFDFSNYTAWVSSYAVPNFSSLSFHEMRLS